MGWVLRELSVTEQRYQAVLAVIEDGVPVTEVAAKIGVSRQTVHAWLSRYADAGLDGLVDRSHRPYGCPHRMPAATEVRLTELPAAASGVGRGPAVVSAGQGGGGSAAEPGGGLPGADPVGAGHSRSSAGP